MSISNVWSLSAYEAIAADWIRREMTKKKYEVFFPINKTLKDIDLILFNTKTKKARTIQVKGSRTYEPKAIERERYGSGGAGWIIVPKIEAKNDSIDFYVFVFHSAIEKGFTKEIVEDYIVIPRSKMKVIMSKKRIRPGNKYHFIVWIDSKGQRAFDINIRSKSPIALSQYLNNSDLLKF